MKVIEGWEKKAIGDFAKTVSGGTPATHIPSYWQNGTIAWLNSGELSKHDFIREPSTLITENALKFSAAKLVPKGSVGIALTGATTGMVGFFKIDTTTNQSITAILPNPTVDTLYLFYVLKNSRKRILGFNIGSAQPHINKQIVDELLVEFPTSKPEQTKIAEILSTADRAIEQTEAIIAKQQRIKTGLMQDLLTRGIDEHGNLRSEETHEFKDSPLGRIPVEWGAVPLKELCHIKHGYAFSGEFFTEQRNENVLLTPGNFYVKGGLYFTKDNTKYFTGPIPEEFILSNGDVLVVMTDLTKEMAILGRTVILYHPDNVLHNQRIGKVLKNRGVRLDLRFLALLMNSDFHRDSIKATATGTTVRHTSPEKLLSPLVPKLSFEEQARIRKRIESIENLMNCTSKELAKARRIKTALMQDLLTGKKRVTPLLNDTEVVHG